MVEGVVNDDSEKVVSALLSQSVPEKPETNNLTRPTDKSAYQKIIFLFLNQNRCCGYSKEPSR